MLVINPLAFCASQSKRRLWGEVYAGTHVWPGWQQLHSRLSCRHWTLRHTKCRHYRGIPGWEEVWLESSTGTNKWRSCTFFRPRLWLWSWWRTWVSRMPADPPCLHQQVKVGWSNDSCLIPTPLRWRWAPSPRIWAWPPPPHALVWHGHWRHTVKGNTYISIMFRTWEHSIIGCWIICFFNYMILVALIL